MISRPDSSLIPFVEMGHWGPERGSNLPKATQHASDPHHLTPLLSRPFSLDSSPKKKSKTYRDFLLARDQSPSLHQQERDAA